MRHRRSINRKTPRRMTGRFHIEKREAYPRYCWKSQVER